MRGYFRNPRNGIASLFDGVVPLLAVSPKFIGEWARSVTKMIQVPIIDCSAFAVLSCDVGQDHLLSVFFVQPLAVD
jgi:hypothetical protein